MLQRIEALENGEHKVVSKNISTAVQSEVVMQNPKQMPEEKTIFGKLLVSLRKMNEVMLISLLGENTEYKLSGHTLKLVSNNEVEFNTLNKQQNIKTLNAAIKQIDEQLNSNNPQRDKLIEIILKAKQRFFSEVCDYEGNIIKNQSFSKRCTVFELSTNELFQRLPYYRELYLNELIKKYGQSVAEKILKEYNIFIKK